LFDYETLKKILFNFEPETAHHFAELGLRALPYIPFLNSYMIKRNFINDSKLSQELFGITF